MRHLVKRPQMTVRIAHGTGELVNMYVRRLEGLMLLLTLFSIAMTMLPPQMQHRLRVRWRWLRWRLHTQARGEQ